jgi:hypothetical protein
MQCARNTRGNAAQSGMNYTFQISFKYVRIISGYRVTNYYCLLMHDLKLSRQINMLKSSRSLSLVNVEFQRSPKCPSAVLTRNRYL